ncbi:MAG: hypothetical protein ABIH39_02430 [Candidatus Margulisiibacteriota bacterium]
MFIKKIINIQSDVKTQATPRYANQKYTDDELIQIGPDLVKYLLKHPEVPLFTRSSEGNYANYSTEKTQGDVFKNFIEKNKKYSEEMEREQKTGYEVTPLTKVSISPDKDISALDHIKPPKYDYRHKTGSFIINGKSVTETEKAELLTVFSIDEVEQIEKALRESNKDDEDDKLSEIIATIYVLKKDVEIPLREKRNKELEAQTDSIIKHISKSNTGQLSKELLPTLKIMLEEGKENNIKKIIRKLASTSQKPDRYGDSSESPYQRINKDHLLTYKDGAVYIDVCGELLLIGHNGDVKDFQQVISRTEGKTFAELSPGREIPVIDNIAYDKKTGMLTITGPMTEEAKEKLLPYFKNQSVSERLQIKNDVDINTASCKYDPKTGDLTISGDVIKKDEELLFKSFSDDKDQEIIRELIRNYSKDPEAIGQAFHESQISPELKYYIRSEDVLSSMFYVLQNILGSASSLDNQETIKQASARLESIIDFVAGVLRAKDRFDGAQIFKTKKTLIDAVELFAEKYKDNPYYLLKYLDNCQENTDPLKKKAINLFAFAVCFALVVKNKAGENVYSIIAARNWGVKAILRASGFEMNTIDVDHAKKVNVSGYTPHSSVDRAIYESLLLIFEKIEERIKDQKLFAQNGLLRTLQEILFINNLDKSVFSQVAASFFNEDGLRGTILEPLLSDDKHDNTDSAIIVEELKKKQLAGQPKKVQIDPSVYYYSVLDRSHVLPKRVHGAPVDDYTNIIHLDGTVEYPNKKH